MKHIFKSLVIIGMVFSILGAPVCPVMAQTLVDQSFTSPHNLGGNINEGAAFIAQTFTAGLTGTLAGVNINVIPRQDTPFLLHVALRSVNSIGEPSSTILGETTLDSGGAPISLLITFPQVINIVAGQRYAIVVNYQGAPPPGAGQFQGIWTGASGNVYTGGEMLFSVSGSSWIRSFMNAADLHFQTFVTLSDFNVCLQDDRVGNSLQINSTTGDYVFNNCDTNSTLSGRGTITIQGCVLTLTHRTTDRNLRASVDTCLQRGNAVLSAFPPGSFSITGIEDSNTADNTYSCP
jgi:hypothetical protein